MPSYYVRRYALLNRPQGSEVEQGGGFGPGGKAARHAPPTDVRETEEFYEVRMELAGADLDRTEITIAEDGQHVVIAGERIAPEHERPCRFVNLEIQYGAFGRTIRLPSPVRGEQASAAYSEGFLTVRLPKAKSTGLRRRVHVETDF